MGPFAPGDADAYAGDESAAAAVGHADERAGADLVCQRLGDGKGVQVRGAHADGDLGDGAGGGLAGLGHEPELLGVFVRGVGHGGLAVVRMSMVHLGVGRWESGGKVRSGTNMIKMIILAGERPIIAWFWRCVPKVIKAIIVRHRGMNIR